MFDIRYLCRLCTLKSSNYSFTYDKELKEILVFKSSGKLDEEDEAIIDYLLDNPQRFTPALTLKPKEFTSIRDNFLLLHDIPIQSFKNRKQLIQFLENNDLYLEWEDYLSIEYASTIRKYIEENDIEEPVASIKDYERIEEELNTLMSNKNLEVLDPAIMHIIDDLDKTNPFLFGYIKNNSTIILKIDYYSSAIALKNIISDCDDSFIDMDLLNSITTYVSFAIDLNKKIVFDPDSFENSVRFTHSSRAYSVTTMPLSVSIDVYAMLKAINVMLNDKKCIDTIKNNRGKAYVNVSSAYESSFDREFKSGEKEFLNALMVYTFNERILNNIDRKFKTKERTNYLFHIEANKNFTKGEQAYIVQMKIKNMTTGVITTIDNRSEKTYNSLEILASKLIDYFKENGKPKEFTIPTFFDYIYLSNALDNWDIKVKYDVIDFEMEETDDDYIKA